MEVQVRFSLQQWQVHKSPAELPCQHLSALCIISSFTLQGRRCRSTWTAACGS